MKKSGLTASDASTLANDISTKLEFMELTRPAPKMAWSSNCEDKSMLKDFLQQRLAFSNETVIELGSDNIGDIQSLNSNQFDQVVRNLETVGESLGASTTVIDRIVKNSSKEGVEEVTSHEGEIRILSVHGHVLVRKQPETIEEIDEVRICVAGNVDAGKVRFDLT